MKYKVGDLVEWIGSDSSDLFQVGRTYKILRAKNKNYYEVLSTDTNRPYQFFVGTFHFYFQTPKCIEDHGKERGTILALL